MYIVEIENIYIRYGRTYGRYIDTYIHINGKSRLVSPVWGSLRLAPIITVAQRSYHDASISDSASVFSKSTPEYVCQMWDPHFREIGIKRNLELFSHVSEVTKAHLSVTHDRISVFCMHKLHG